MGLVGQPLIISPPGPNRTPPPPGSIIPNVHFLLSPSPTLGSHRYRERFLVAEFPIQQVRLLPDDQLVYVGSMPYLYNLYPLTYMAPRGGIHSLTPVERSNSHILCHGGMWPWGISDHLYTHINGVAIEGYDFISELFELLPRTQARWSASYVFTGYPGQELALGRWQGTRWYERIITVNSMLFETSPIELSYETTFDGYFILNFDPSTRNVAIALAGHRSAIGRVIAIVTIDG